MKRTDFTSEIDGAMATRNVGMRHFSEIARSGNGDMLSDLSETELAGYDELDGIGEVMEELSCAESRAVDGLGTMPMKHVKSPRGFSPFRETKAGETPPYAPKRGHRWLRRRHLTAMRKPGGNRVARVKWAHVRNDIAKTLSEQGQVQGMGAFGLSTGVITSVGMGVAAGTILLMLLKKKKGK